MPLQPRPQGPDFPGGDEGEHVVGLGLAHELADQVGAHLGVGVGELPGTFGYRPSLGASAGAGARNGRAS